ncbi:rab GTPase-binding effector protein 2 isoform X2 [Chanos chanos]|uniref:Rab GTPase-binding effector protein 2 n=1 Tax=Chanos chanos TaxID=29144 RepID=A0A6J2WZ83_CHACN|nr:rab GTPase-binding effector protein 2 isoform X2 [Chanos chanos]
MEESDKPPPQNEENAELEVNLEVQLADCRAQLEHWQGVATICELSKREELQELQTQCDQEIQSLQEALRETTAQYEARISALQSERAQWRRTGASPDNKASIKKGRMEGESSPTDSSPSHSPDPDSSDPRELMAEGPEVEGAGLLMEGYAIQQCDSASLASFSMDTPSLPRRPPPQDDTASLLSTGTLVPEAIYLPPPGHRLVSYTDWDALQTQISELQGEVTQLREQRAELEKELDIQTTETQKQVTVLQSQVQTSETLLQELQKSFSQSQNAVQSRLAELSLSQKRVCSELSRLKGGDDQEDEGTGDPHTPTLQGALPHCEERLRIEIVNLKEQLETRTEESVLEVQLSSLKTETDRIQSQKDKLETELQECRIELQGLRMALSHLQGDNKSLNNDKAALQQQCLELRSQIISLRSQLDTSQAVQKDFVQLSQSLQVKLEQIRQAETLDQVREILGEGLSKDPPPDAT